MGATRNLPQYPDDKMTIPQPRHSEPSANTEPGGRLRGMMLGCLASPENMRRIVGRPGLRLCKLKRDLAGEGRQQADAFCARGRDVLGYAARDQDGRSVG